jgi:membrane associated rhomboid family serine protease
MNSCYRHPDRETGLSCTNCGRPICAECATHAAVGIRCPECSGRQRTVAAGFTLPHEPIVTYMLLAANVGLYLITQNKFLGLGAGGLFSGGALNHRGYEMTLIGPAVANGDYYRLITSGFIHYGPVHLGFNMFALWLLGRPLEGYLGSVRFGLVYLVSLLAGSFGALLLSPNAATAGASGAIFGLMGAMFVLERQRGMALLGGGIGGLILINLLFTFSMSGISIGGHIGGLIGGALSGLVLSHMGYSHMAHGKLSPLTVAALAVLGAAAVAGSLLVAGSAA